MQEVEQLGAWLRAGKGEEEKKGRLSKHASDFPKWKQRGEGRGWVGVEGRVSSSKPSALSCGRQEWLSTLLLSLPWHISHSVPLLKLCSLWLQKRVNVTHLASSLCRLLPLPERILLLCNSFLKIETFLPAGKFLKEGKQLKITSGSP